MDPDPDLVDYLIRSTRLNSDEARKVIQDIVGFMDETVPDYVQRRHRALQEQGAHNAEIYRRIVEELKTRRFRAGEHSERQIRRLIYG